MDSDAIDSLSERERACLRLVAEGFNTKQIARQIGVSDGRAAKIIDAANQKLGVSSRMDAARLLASYEQRGVNVIPGRTSPLAAFALEDPLPLPTQEARQPQLLREERAPYGASDSYPELGLPLRSRGSVGNDLKTWQRVTWMVLLWAVALLGIGSLASQLGDVTHRIIVVPDREP